MSKQFIIKKANTKNLKKLNQFHNNYYKTNRTIKQFLWLFRKTSKFYDFYYALNKKKIVGTLGFIKFNFIHKKKSYNLVKPEDILITRSERGKNIFEGFNKIYEKKNSNSNVISIIFSAVGKTLKRINYTSYFGSRTILIKYYHAKGLAELIAKKKIPKLFSYLFAHLIICYLKIFTFIKNNKIKGNLTFINYNKAPKWTNNINKKFTNYWNFFTTDRTEKFLQWRVFDNPFLKEKFTAFYFNKIPVGYIIYNINMKNLYVVDLVVVPVNGTINANMIINEVLSYLDGYCVKKKLNYCKFELYLNNKLNNLLKNSLPRFSYISKKVDTNFSFKIFNKSVNKKIMMDAYLTNINKSGKIY